MRWWAGALGLLVTAACAGSTPPAPATPPIPGMLPPATRTAIAVAVTQAPAPARTAVAAVLEAPRSLGPFDYLDPRALATDPPRYVGKALVLQGEAGLVRERDRVVYFALLAVPRDSPVPQRVHVNSFGETSARVRQGDCYRVDGVGGGTDQAVPYVIGLQITALGTPLPAGCAAP